DAEQTPPLSWETTEKSVEPALIDAMHLTVAQTHQLLKLLDAYEQELCRWADQDLRQQEAARDRLNLSILRRMREADTRHVDLRTRAFPWQHQPDADIWICDQPPNRGTVSLAENSWFWRGCVERPHRVKEQQSNFISFEEALAWIEQQLAS